MRLMAQVKSTLGLLSRPSPAKPPVDEFGELFIKLAVGLQIDSAVEVGAHAAEFSIEISRRLPGIKAIALEANPFVFERFRNRVPSAVEYLNMAASRDETPTELHIVKSIQNASGRQQNVDRANTISGLMVRAAQNAQYETVKVNSTTLDALFGRNALRRAALWIDVEGANEAVLGGATAALANTACLMIEVEDHSYWEDQWLSNDVDRFLATAGFSLLAKERVDRPQYNAIYARADLTPELNPWRLR